MRLFNRLICFSGTSAIISFPRFVSTPVMLSQGTLLALPYHARNNKSKIIPVTVDK
jgi:hypothetical protein